MTPAILPAIIFFVGREVIAVLFTSFIVRKNKVAFIPRKRRVGKNVNTCIKLRRLLNPALIGLNSNTAERRYRAPTVRNIRWATMRAS